MKKFDFYRLHLVHEGLYVKLSRRAKIYRILNAICGNCRDSKVETIQFVLKFKIDYHGLEE